VWLTTHLRDSQPEGERDKLEILKHMGREIVTVAEICSYI